jgi:hypothetical protein
LVAYPGTIIVSVVAVLSMTAAGTTYCSKPLNSTTLLAGTRLKFEPVMVTSVPAGPSAGEKPVMVGAGTVKLPILVAVCDPITTDIVPLVAFVGTVVVILVSVLAVTVAVTPLNFTMLLAGMMLKFEPVMITVVPTCPLVGVKLVIAGTSMM